MHEKAGRGAGLWLAGAGATGLLAMATFTALAVSPAEAANIAGPRRSALERLAEGDAIRRRMLLRGGRFEVTPAIGFTLNDPFRRTFLAGGTLSYHLTDSLSIGATVLGGLPYNSALADRIGEARPERVEDGAFSNLALLASAELQYAPLIGKFAVFGRYVFNYDLHLIGGVGVGLRSGERDVGGASPMPVLGLGLRTFVSNWMAVNLEVRDYIYRASINAVPRDDGEGGTRAEESWSNNFAVTIGFSFYFPEMPKLSD
jgi:outer membrane beta-barrel protein